MGSEVVRLVSWLIGASRIPLPEGGFFSQVILCCDPQAQPDEEWESCWFQVMVKGPPSGCYQAFKMISGLVDGEFLTPYGAPG
jgi:hypothetical protein